MPPKAVVVETVAEKFFEVASRPEPKPLTARQVAPPSLERYKPVVVPATTSRLPLAALTPSARITVQLPPGST